jgi:hypothetical protein
MCVAIVAAAIAARVSGAAAEDLDALRAAAGNGDRDARYRLGMAYRSGTGVARNDERALYWLGLAASQCSAPAMDAVGRMYRAGEGAAQNDATAARYFRLSAAQRDPGGMYDWGEALLQNRAFIDDARGDRAVAAACPQLDAAKDVAAVKSSQGDTLFSADPAALRATGVRYVRLAADAGEMHAQVRLGDLYEAGTAGLAQSYAEAARWYARAAARGDQDAKSKIAALRASGKIP